MIFQGLQWAGSISYKKTEKMRIFIIHTILLTGFYTKILKNFQPLWNNIVLIKRSGKYDCAFVWFYIE